MGLLLAVRLCASAERRAKPRDHRMHIMSRKDRMVHGPAYPFYVALVLDLKKPKVGSTAKDPVVTNQRHVIPDGCRRNPAVAIMNLAA